MLVFEALMKANSLGLVVSVNLRSASELLSKVKLWAEVAKQASKGKLDTIQRVVYSVYSIWKGLRKKLADKRKGHDTGPSRQTHRSRLPFNYLS